MQSAAACCAVLCCGWMRLPLLVAAACMGFCLCMPADWHVLTMQARCPRFACWWATLRRPTQAAPAGTPCAAAMPVPASGACAAALAPPPPPRQVRGDWRYWAHCVALCCTAAWHVIVCNAAMAHHLKARHRSCCLALMSLLFRESLQPCRPPCLLVWLHASHVAAAAEDDGRAAAASAPEAATGEASVKVPAAGTAGTTPAAGAPAPAPAGTGSNSSSATTSGGSSSSSASNDAPVTFQKMYLHASMSGGWLAVSPPRPQLFCASQLLPCACCRPSAAERLPCSISCSTARAVLLQAAHPPLPTLPQL